jgi:hypothetical protein
MRNLCEESCLQAIALAVAILAFKAALSRVGFGSAIAQSPKMPNKEVVQNFVQKNNFVDF